MEQFENQNRNVLLKDFEIGGYQPLESGIKGFDYRHEQFRDLRILWDLFDETTSGMRLVLGSWNRSLHMRKMHAAYGKESTIQQRQI